MAQSYDVAAIEKLLYVAKRMDEKNMMNAYEGNISLKENGYLYITPSGKNKALLTHEQVAVFDENGNQVSGIYKASSELPMHTAIYHMRDNIGGIVHAHCRFLTAYALCNIPLQSNAHVELVADHKSIEVVPYGRPGTDAIYAGVKPVLDTGRSVMLLANHGAIAVGRDVFEAMNRLESVEHAAEILTICKMVGEPMPLPESEYLHYFNR